MSQQDPSSTDTHLYIGVNPKTRRKGQDAIPSFTGDSMIPIAWYFLYEPSNIVERGEEFPDSIRDFDSDDTLENLEQYLEEPVALKVALPDAKTRLAQFREVFKSIPYIWSYFKVIDVLDRELEKYIEGLEDKTVQPVVARTGSHPETKLSQVKIKKGSTSTTRSDTDNPFAELEQLGAEPSDTDHPQEDGSIADQLNDLSDVDLFAALEEAAALDFEEEPSESTAENKVFVDEEDGLFMPVVVYFNNIASKGRGSRLGRIPILLERLMHHARREGSMTRIMQDLMQEIFREAQSGWRITGQLAEDFVQGNPAELSEIMIGKPSPFVIIGETLDLEYWTQGTLQSGDERLMYTLTMLPSEEIHIAIKAGKLTDISDRVGDLLVTTQGVRFPRLTVPLLKKPPLISNIWGFRVLIKDLTGEFRAATLLISDPSISWEKEFETRINLPGVLEDWNVEFPVRFEEFSDIDHYQVVFEGARDMEDAFNGFVRWVRRHSIMYQRKYGVEGTILTLKGILEETQDKLLGQRIFDMLTNLTELGFNTAMDALSDDAIVSKLPWLYS